MSDNAVLQKSLTFEETGVLWLRIPFYARCSHCTTFHTKSQRIPACGAMEITQVSIRPQPRQRAPHPPVYEYSVRAESCAARREKHRDSRTFHRFCFCQHGPSRQGPAAWRTDRGHRVGWGSPPRTPYGVPAVPAIASIKRMDSCEESCRPLRQMGEKLGARKQEGLQPDGSSPSRRFHSPSAR